MNCEQNKNKRRQHAIYGDAGWARINPQCRITTNHLFVRVPRYP